MADLLGGFTKPVDATEEIQKICDDVKSQVEEKTGKRYEVFTAVQFISQLVTGTNYIIKVQVDGCGHLFLTVFQSLPCQGGKIVLNSVQEDKDDTAPLF